MILLITNKEDVTVDFVVQELRDRNCAYYRLNTEDIPDVVSVSFQISAGKYYLFDREKNVQINLADVSAVYYRRPKISALGHISPLDEQENQYLKSELYFLIHGIYKTLRDTFWINDVYKIREAENKIFQLQMAQATGFKIPFSIITNCFVDAKKMIEYHDCITKPIKSGNMPDPRHPKVIFTSVVDESSLRAPERLESFPCYFQENIEKECDIRCIVVGEHVFAARIESQGEPDGRVDWRKSSVILPHKKIQLPDTIEQKSISITRQLGLVYSAIDFVLDKAGNYIFLECNPNGQWAWIEKRLGYQISSCIVDYLQKDEI